MPASDLNRYISVDIETAGPNPSQYSLLSIGACLVADLERTFYVEMQPVHDLITPDAFSVHHLSLDQLKKTGLPPRLGMQQFADWLGKTVPPDQRPLFVAFNASFDWMFVNDYFHRFLGRNPFGHSALDIKAFFMGQKGVAWEYTSMEKISKHYTLDKPLAHHALQDAQDQARLFLKMLSGT